MRLEQYLVNEKWEGVKQWHAPHKKRGEKGEPLPDGWWYEEMWNDYILDDCKPYLKLMKQAGMDKPLYRSVNLQGGVMDNEIHAYSVRKDRKPKGMPKFLSDPFNKWLQKNGHARRDRSVIATPLKLIALDHGSPRFIFPMGKFKYTFVHGAGDINVDSYTAKQYGTQETDYARFMLNYMFDVDDYKQKEWATDWMTKNTYSTKFKLGVDSGSEIWFECDNYYIIAQAAWDGLKEYYKKL